MFDWLSFLDSNHISYRTGGANISRGNAAVRCPWCGDADDSGHMAISLTGRGWFCWRDRRHRGRSPVRLIAALLGVTTEQAKRIAGVRTAIPDDFLDTIKGYLGQTDATDEEEVVDMPDEFRPLRKSVMARPVFSYLQRRRGFSEQDIAWLAEAFDLRYSISGRFANRVIMPVTLHGSLRSWTARHIGNSTLRYLSRDGGDAITNFLYGYDQAVESDADTICLVEGPMDVLKVWTLGRKHGIAAIGFFTAAPSDAQVELLYGLLPWFANRYLLLDANTLATSLRIQQDTSLGLLVRLMQGRKDPGDLETTDELLRIVRGPQTQG